MEGFVDGDHFQEGIARFFFFSGTVMGVGMGRGTAVMMVAVRDGRGWSVGAPAITMHPRFLQIVFQSFCLFYRIRIRLPFLSHLAGFAVDTFAVALTG